jgi:hypothetical protein
MLVLAAWLQMARILTAELAGFYEAYYVAKGIRLIKQQRAKEFKGDGKVRFSSSGHSIRHMQLALYRPAKQVPECLRNSQQRRRW